MTEQAQAGVVPAWTRGDRMRKALEHSGVSVAAMADYLDVTPATISRWTNDKTPPVKILQTATPTGKVHLVRDGQTVTFCGRRAALGPTGPAWPRWSPGDRGLAPIHRTACERCAAEARAVR